MVPRTSDVLLQHLLSQQNLLLSNSLPIPELQRISYGEGFVAERLQMLKKAREVALADSFKAGDMYKEAHDKKLRSITWKKETMRTWTINFFGKK